MLFFFCREKSGATTLTGSLARLIFTKPVQYARETGNNGIVELVVKQVWAVFWETKFIWGGLTMLQQSLPL